MDYPGPATKPPSLVAQGFLFAGTLHGHLSLTLGFELLVHVLDGSRMEGLHGFEQLPQDLRRTGRQAAV